MSRNVVSLRTDYNSNEIKIAVGSSEENLASADEIDVEYDESGMLTITFPEDKRELPLNCVVGGSWKIDGRWQR